MLVDANLLLFAIHRVSADTDFARFTEIRWENPLTSAR